MNKNKQFILWFKNLTIEDVPLVGGKNASLGEMYRHLTKKKVNIPNGFAITAYAYRYFITKAGIKDKIARIIKSTNINNIHNLQTSGLQIRELIRNASFPRDLQEEITEAYKKL